MESTYRFPTCVTEICGNNAKSSLKHTLQDLIANYNPRRSPDTSRTSKTRTQNARVLHQLRLKGVQNDKPQNILSEGERRIISLAAFLADVSDKPGAAPFVFDDPISSLDNDFEWHVACRLVELAKVGRFLSLLTDYRYMVHWKMWQKAGEAWKDAHYHPMCIEAYAGIAGHPAAQDVWNANTKKANNILLTRLDAARKAGEAGVG